MKYLIISQLKAGTYLTGNLLEELGLYHTYLHLDNERYQKYDRNDLERSKLKALQYTIKESMDVSIKLVKDGQFAITHAKHTPRNESLFSEFKKVIVTRPWSECVKSLGVWNKEANKRLVPNKAHHEDVLKWIGKPDTFNITFNDLISKNTDKLDDLQVFLFGEVKYNSISSIESALRRDSITKSDKRKHKGLV